MFHKHDHHHHGRRHARPERAEQSLTRNGHRGGGHRGLGRFFAHGDLRLVILNLIAEKPRHG